MHFCLSGLSVERPCARSVKVDTPCVFSQVSVRGGVVWALSEHKALFYREGLNSYCSEGDHWKYDTVRYYCSTTATVLRYKDFLKYDTIRYYCSSDVRSSVVSI